MSCPTCDHTLDCIADSADGRRVLHCERCGTLVVRFLGDTAIARISPIAQSVYVPKLVERCRDYVHDVYVRHNAYTPSQWHTLGIAESINKPEDRK